MYIADIVLREHTVSLQHFAYRPVQSACRLFRICYNRDKQVRYAVISHKFNGLRVNHYKLYVFGLASEKYRHDYRVHAYGFTRSGRTCNQQMGHLGYIGYYYAARNILTQHSRQLAFLFGYITAFDKLSEWYGISYLVRHFDAYSGFIGYRRFDPDAG